MANQKKNGGQKLQNGANTIAQQSAICQSNNSDLFVAYAFNHREMTFPYMHFTKSFNAMLRQAAMLIDLNTTFFGSQSMKVAEVTATFNIGFIDSEDRDNQLENIYYPESFDSWDEPIRIWTNAEAGISVGAAPVEEFLTLLPDEALTILEQRVTKELGGRKNA